ncbi:MAG: hypothetical protein LBC11_03690, partial [Puniceicoccales bacterium]|nr:hypothetical protein [Puniceicoccales bacterium]
LGSNSLAGVPRREILRLDSFAGVLGRRTLGPDSLAGVPRREILRLDSFAGVLGRRTLGPDSLAGVSRRRTLSSSLCVGVLKHGTSICFSEIFTSELDSGLDSEAISLFLTVERLALSAEDG